MRLITMLLVPSFTQVFPSWVLRYDKRNFFDPRQSFYLLFSGDGCMHGSETLEIYQAIEFVARGKAMLAAVFVFKHPCFQFAGHSRV